MSSNFLPSQPDPHMSHEQPEQSADVSQSDFADMPTLPSGEADQILPVPQTPFSAQASTTINQPIPQTPLSVLESMAAGQLDQQGFQAPGLVDQTMPQNMQASEQQPGQPVPQTPFPPQGQTLRGVPFMAQPMQMVRRISNKMDVMRRAIPQRPLAQYLSNKTANTRQSAAPTDLSNQTTSMFQPATAVDPHPVVRSRVPQRPRPVSAPSNVPTPATPVRPEPWRRSRAQRVSRIIRKRRSRVYGVEPKRKRLRTILLSVITGILATLIISISISSYLYYASQLPQLQSLANLQLRQSSHFYDRNGNLLYTLADGLYGRSTPITYNEIPGFMQDAQIAAEDKSFWTNNGVDPQAILRSAFQDTSSQQIQSGASTITQQVVRNLDHKTQQNVQRKLSEAALAVGLTNQYPKWKILEMYFNIAPFGTQDQGIEAAAQDFFGLKPMCDANFKCIPAVAFLDRDLSKCKSADESTCAVNPILGLARASILASIPQNPPAYDPLANSDDTKLLQRQDYVLKQMMSDGMSINLGLGAQTQNAEPITPAIIQQAEALSKNIQFTGFQGGKRVPGFVDWVVTTLATALGNGDYDTGLGMLEDGGFNVKTTLDLNLETYVESAIHRHIDQPEQQFYINRVETLSQSDNLQDSATVVIDAKTGEVLAMDGTAGNPGNAGASSINMALKSRQPGSSFKPIEVAASYEMGFYPGIVLPDKKTYFPKGLSQSLTANDTNTYSPPDYSGYTNKPTTIVSAISQSLNVPALKTEYYAGFQNVYNMAARLGITSIDPRTGLFPSMGLGTNGVSLLQMTSAYQTFADQGVHIPPQGILGIWDNYGHQLYQYNPGKAGAQVLSPQIAYLVTSTLDNEADRAPEFLNDHVLSMNDWPQPGGGYPQVAAKTGTTDSFKDNWTIGYTPDVVVGVWSGNADDSPMKTTIGVTGAAPIWHSVIEYASGKCNTNGNAYDNYRDADQVPCPPLDLSYNDRTFTVPPNIVQQQVNTVNGLQGSGFTTQMIDGEQPQQGNVSDSSSPNKPPKKKH